MTHDKQWDVIFAISTDEKRNVEHGRLSWSSMT